MSKEELDMDDSFESDNFDDFLNEGEEPKRQPPSNAREAASYAISDVTSGVKEGFSKANLTQNLKALTSNLAPAALDKEYKQISGIKDLLNKELEDVLKENKDKIANISGFIASRTKSGGFFNKIASSINESVSDRKGADEESVESIAQRVVAGELDSAMGELGNKIESKRKFTQQEALNKIYISMLKTEAFNRGITSTYYRKSLEYQYIHLTTSKKLYDVNKDGFAKIENALAYVVKNTGLPDIVKLRSMEAVEAQARAKLIDSGLGKLFGDNGWAVKIVSKLKSKKQDISAGLSGLDEGIESYKTMSELNEMMAEMGGGSTTKMVASMLPAMAMSALGKKLSGVFSRTERGSRFIDFGKDLLSNPSEILKNTAKNLSDSKTNSKYLNYIKSKMSGGIAGLADFLDTDTDKKSMTVNTKDLYEAATIDRKTMITWNEVIPSLLSKIFREVYLLRTGADESKIDEMKFDYGSRSFSTGKAMGEKLTNKIGSIIKGSGAAADIATMSNFILSKSGAGYDEATSSKVRAGITSFLQSGKSFKPTQLDDDFYKHFDKDTVEKVRMGMDAINSDKNINRGKERGMLRETFGLARGKIPAIDNLIEAQIDAGNTDLLVRQGIIVYDHKLGKYKASAKAYDKLVMDNMAMYKGSGYNYDFGTNTSKKDFMGGARDAYNATTAFGRNVSGNIDRSGFSVRANSNRPATGSMFSINKSGTNSLMESAATELAFRAKMFNANPNMVKTKKYVGAQFNLAKGELTKAVTSSKLYKDMEAEFKALGVKIDKAKVFKEGEEAGLDKIHTMENLIDEANRSLTGSYIDMKDAAKVNYLRAALEVKAITPDEYMDGIYKVMLDKKAEMEIPVGSISQKAKGVYSKYKKKITDRYNKDTTIQGEFENIKADITSGLASVKKSKRYKSLQTMVTTKMKQLGLENVKNLKPKHILDLTNILVSSKHIEDIKPSIVTYLYTNNLMPEQKLNEHLVEIENTSANTEYDGNGKMSIRSRLSNMFSAARNLNVLKSFKRSKEEQELTPKEVETLEEAIEKKEDSRIKSIVTSVIENLGLSKDKKASGDSDGDGVRDGSWMSKFRFGKKENQSTTAGEDISKKATEDKKSSPMWMIAKLLLMGVPILVSKISGMFTDIGGVWGVVKKIPGLLLDVVSSLGGKVWDGLKWLGGTVFDLGKTVVSGIGSGLVTLGEKVGGFVLDLGKSLLSGITELGGKILSGFAEAVTAIAGKLLDIGKGIASAVVSGVSGAISSIKSIFGFGDDAVDALSDIPGEIGDDLSIVDKDGKPITSNKTSTPDIDGNKSKEKWWKKIVEKGKKLGKGLVKNPIVKKIPIVGGVVMAGTAAYNFAQGDLSGGFTNIASGVIGSIPVVGTALSYGIDYAGEKYKEWNPTIDKALYNNQNFANVSMDAMDQITLNHIRKKETGTAAGKYDTAGDIGDGAGISFGAYQFTEKSGNLKEYLTRLVAVTNDPVGQNYLSKFEGNNYTGIKAGLIKYLKETGDTPAGKYVQDSMYKEMFLDPAKKLAASYGITNPASISQIIDHSVNAGLGGAKRMLKYAHGDYSPESIARARKNDYNGIIAANSSLAKYRDNWMSRVDDNAKLFVSESNKIATAQAPDTVDILNHVNPVNTSSNPEVNTVLQGASKIVGNDQAPIVNNVNANSGITATTLPTTGTSMVEPAMVSAPTFNTATLEKLISTGNAALLGIQANTTSMVGNNGLLITAINNLSKNIELALKQTKTNNVVQNTIKAPMGEGIGLNKPKM